jgi:uncharacterized protein
VSHFLYKLIPPRPTFDQDMDEAEATIMGEHVTYWRAQTERGTAIVFGAVADPDGVWGLAVVDAESEEDVRTIGLRDPAVASQLAHFEVYAMPGAVTARTALSARR